MNGTAPLFGVKYNRYNKKYILHEWQIQDRLKAETLAAELKKRAYKDVSVYSQGEGVYYVQGWWPVH
jgi:hypothetical protein